MKRYYMLEHNSKIRDTWLFWRDINRAPALNMAIDELLLLKSERLGGKPLLRIYGWSRPSISFGYSQKYPDSADTKDFFKVRRPTGGGIVFHGKDLTYTVVVPSGHYINTLDRLESYRVFHLAVAKAIESCNFKANLAKTASELKDRKQMRCFDSPSVFDVMSVSDKRKIAGAAQRRSKKGILHQGSISIDILNIDREFFAEKLRSSFESYFKLDFEDFKIPEGFIGKAQKLASAKFATDEWNKNQIGYPAASSARR